MEFRNVGNSDLVVSVAGLGCNNFGMRLDEGRTADVVNAAIDAGINFFDTARMYGGGKSEEFLGAAVKSRRSEVIIATKFGAPTGPDHRKVFGVECWLQGELAPRFEKEAGKIFADPWTARDDYIFVILNRSPENVAPNRTG